MKAAWVNVIIKLTSLIQNLKASLLTSHALKSIFIVIYLIGLEIMLSLLSFPLFLVENNTNSSQPETKEYRTRRAITLSMVGAIAIVWLCKLLLIIAGQTVFKGSSEITIDQRAASPLLEVTQEHIFGVQAATLNTALTKPALTQVQHDQDRGIEFTGNANPGHYVFVYLYRLGTESVELNTAETQTVTIVATEANDQGVFKVIPDSAQFAFEPGRYQVEAVALDPETHTFSEPSAGSVFMVEASLFNNPLWLSSLDTLLNLSIFGFILLGVMLTFLVT